MLLNETSRLVCNARHGTNKPHAHLHVVHSMDSHLQNTAGKKH